MPSTQAPSYDALREAITRIGTIVRAETERLREPFIQDLSASNDQKARALLHFDRTLRRFDPVEARAHLAPDLEALRAHLEENRRMLAVHAEAARHVTALVAEAMLAHESDGTYARYPQKAPFSP